jgi:hypothetical protein
MCQIPQKKDIKSLVMLIISSVTLITVKNDFPSSVCIILHISEYNYKAVAVTGVGSKSEGEL